MQNVELINYVITKINLRYFTIVGSKLIRQKTKYHVSVASQGFDGPQTLEIAIRNTKKDDKKFEIVQNVTLINGKTQKIEFDVSKYFQGSISCLIIILIPPF